MVGSNGWTTEDLAAQVFSDTVIMAFSVLYLLSSSFPRTTRYSPAMINDAPMTLRIAFKTNNKKSKQILITTTTRLSILLRNNLEYASK